MPGPVTIVLTNWPGAPSPLPVRVNGRPTSIPVNEPVEVGEDVLAALFDADVAFHVVDGADGSGEAPVSPEVLALLDLSIAALAEKLGALTERELVALLDAETSGKTRAGAIAEITKALDALR